MIEFFMFSEHSTITYPAC
uniref:Uncharacterized protein n=1 Tax=Arundo donax TaxID=35708 RepID=A0A0A9A3U6_ARUDO